MEDRLPMTSLGLRLDHRLWPSRSPAAAQAVGEALDHPAFRELRRVAWNRGDRDSKHQPRTAKAVADILLSPDYDSAVLDSGRTGELTATAAIYTGRHVRNYPVENQIIHSYVVVPLDPAHPLEIVEGFALLASALDVLSGCICVERSQSSARTAAFGNAPPLHEVRDFPRRTKERKAYSWYWEKNETEIAGPEWGLFLGPGHLARVTPDPTVFPVIRDAGQGKLVLLSENPEDALTEAFDAQLEQARRALGSVMMDVSEVPVR